MYQAILRAIQGEIHSIRSKLDNPRTGLGEIKSEIEDIECMVKKLNLDPILCKLHNLAEELQEVENAINEIEGKLDSPEFGLQEISDGIEELKRKLCNLDLDQILHLLSCIKDAINDVENKLDSDEFGLAEIKQEVAQVEDAVTDPETGLPEIKSEVVAIEGILQDPAYGLEEIKNEISAIETKLDNFNLQQILALLASISGTVLMLEQKLDNPNFGLEEIKCQVTAIQTMLGSPAYGLEEIKTQVSAIETKLDSPEFGLQEIKQEVAQILQGMGVAGYITTGPIFRGSTACSVVTVVQNNATTPQQVTIEGYSILPGPVVPLPGAPVTVTLTPGQSFAVIFGFIQPPLPKAATLAYEIRVLMNTGGTVSVFSAARTQNVNSPLGGSTLLAENTVKYAEFKPVPV